MSEDLRKRLRVYLASKQLAILLERVNSLKFIGFVGDSDQLIPPEKAYKDMILIEAQPVSKINMNTSYADLSKWLLDCLGKAQIKEECYLIIAEFGELPWAKVQFPASGDWLISLWSLLETRSLILLSSNQTTVLGLFEEEHSYEAYIQQMGESI